MILVVIISLLTVLALAAPGYFPMHDDLQVMRIFQMEKCFADGQIPCRWVPDMTFGYGQAMFNFYSALPYYFGILVRLLTPFSIIDTVKILFAISLVVGSVGMYFLAREFFGRSGAAAAAVLYALAPYRAVNVYVRGALAESVSLAILPILWLFIYKAIKKPGYKYMALLALSVAALLMTHNISTLMYFGFTVVWGLFWLVQNMKLKRIVSVAVGALMGFGLAGFFIIPVIFETSLIKDEVFVSDYSYFVGHFTTLNQLFISRFWGYGGSIFGENDGMSFQVGWPHWWAAILVGLLAVYRLYQKNDKKAYIVLSLLAMSSLALFLTHNKSTFIWTALPAITFVQFPWRFLGIAVFLIAFAGGGISFLRNKLLEKALVLIVLVLAIVLNINYFKPERTYGWLTDEIKLTGVDFLVQQGAAFLDYLPKTVNEPPLETAPGKPEIVSGSGEIPNFTHTSSTFFFDANISEESTIDIPIIYFPHWEVYLLVGQGVAVHASPSDIEGLIRITLPAGKHMVYGKLVNTPVRSAANAVTVVSFLALVAGYIISANKRKDKLYE